MTRSKRQYALLLDEPWSKDQVSAYDNYESLQDFNRQNQHLIRRNPQLFRSSDFPERIDFFGNPLCRWCCGLVFKPRRTFCSNDCGKQVRIRTSAGALRDEVFNRDTGCCCKCGTQSRSLWEADHIKEITDGGDVFDMDNLQTLCVPCHKTKSAESRRKREPRRYKIGAEFARRGLSK